MAPLTPLDATMNDLLAGLISLLGLVYGRAWVVPFLILPFMLICAFWLIHRAKKQTQPYLDAAKVCTDTLRSALETDSDPSAERLAFSRNFDRVTSVFLATDRRTNLLQAWREFHETIVDESASPIQNTSRPFPFFQRVEPKQDQLSFWSNAFVGIGLVLTFLGLIVALRTAAAGMEGGDVRHAQGALTALLTVSGAKFFTSIGGIGASLWLRFAESDLTKKTKSVTREICELLERGLVYIPPQRLAAQQLMELREQTGQLKLFNQDIAFKIADRINVGVTDGMVQAFAPMASSLNSMNESMVAVTQGIGAGAAKAINDASGYQLRVLSATLNKLSERLDSISSVVTSSGDQAAQQIRDAGADFRVAAADIKGAFEQLTGNVSALGSDITNRASEAAQTQSAVLERALANLEAAQSRSAGSIEEAVNVLKVAAERVANDMEGAVGDQIRRGVAETGATFKSVLEESGGAMLGASTGLAKAIDEASKQVQLASDGFVQSADAARDTSAAMAGVSAEARLVASEIGEMGKGFATVSGPVLAAVQAMNQAVNLIAQTLEAGREAEADVLQELQALAREIKQAQTAAEQAWLDYRGRFETVDKSLASTMTIFSETLGNSLRDFNSFAQDVDTAMAGAISKLSVPLDQMNTYAESLDGFVEAQRLAARGSE
jgi:hypothetical protein